MPPETRADTMVTRTFELADHEAFASLLASTRMVGMECPGLHSVYSQLALEFTGADRVLVF